MFRSLILALSLIVGVHVAPCWAGIDFDGSDDHLTINSADSLRDLPATYDFTVCFWFNSDGATTDNGAFSWSGTDDLVFYPNDSNIGSGGVRVFWRDLGGNIIDQNGTDRTGAWHHFTFVSRASDDHEAYFDGVSADTSSSTGSAGPFTSVFIGTFGTQNFNGQLDDVRVYDRALSDTEIETLGKGRIRRGILTGLVGYWALDDGPDGTSADGDTIRDISGANGDATGVDGANNTGLTWNAGEVLTYP